MYALESQYALELVSPHHISKQVSHNIFIYPPYALERYDFKPSLVLHLRMKQIIERCEVIKLDENKY